MSKPSKTSSNADNFDEWPVTFEAVRREQLDAMLKLTATERLHLLEELIEQYRDFFPNKLETPE